MMTRFSASRQISEIITDKALSAIAGEIDTDAGRGIVPLIVFNPLNWTRTDIVDTGGKYN